MVLAVLLLCSSVFAQLSVNNTFGCQSEFILFNASSQLYDGIYQDCNKPPVLTIFNVTNATIDNRTVIEVANYTINLTTIQCNEAGLVDAVVNETSQLLFHLEGQFNATQKYADCQGSRDSAIGELSSCNNKIDDFQTNYMKKEDAGHQIDLCKSDVNVTATRLNVAENNLGYYSVGAFIAGVAVVWFFRLRRPDTDRMSNIPDVGDYDVNMGAINSDARNAQKGYASSVEQQRNPSKGIESKRNTLQGIANKAVEGAEDYPVEQQRNTQQGIKKKRKSKGDS